MYIIRLYSSAAGIPIVNMEKREQSNKLIN